MSRTLPCPARAWLSALVLVVACGPPSSDGTVALDTPEVTAALAAIDPAAIQRHMSVLADDSLAGRAPGTAGHASAAAYAEHTLSGLGLQPAGEGGGFRQRVPLRRSVVVESESAMTVAGAGGSQPLVYDVDYYVSPDPRRERVEIDDAPLVFVGYGVSAPSLGYDDYASVDPSGKVVAWLSGAPASFPSNERAYYSSGATKEAEAVARGAIGIVTLSLEDARTRWEAATARAKTGAFAWLDAAGQPSRGTDQIRGSASISRAAAERLFEGAPVTVDEALAAAAESRPQGFDLASRVSMRTTTRHEAVESFNLVAKLEGSDPALRDEYVTYVAHVDHFGVGVEVNGDDVYNGAHDNASGTAIVLEIARAFTSLPTAPRRSILFLIVTAEEWGLLGSDYFVRNPTVPRSGLVANFSLDMPFLFHPLHDIVPYGAEHSSMGADVAAAAEVMGLGIGPDPIPEQVLFIRSDHFSFIRQGIPALFIKSGFETGDPSLDGGAINRAYRSNVYHTPFDDMGQSFDFGAGADHARVNFLTGYRIAQSDAPPTWNPGDFFGTLFGDD